LGLSIANSWGAAKHRHSNQRLKLKVIFIRVSP
jgi:hypothetical protein